MKDSVGGIVGEVRKVTGRDVEEMEVGWGEGK